MSANNPKSFLGKLLISVRNFSISKRQRFVVAVLFLSMGLYVTENFSNQSGIFLAFLLAILTDICLLLANYKDIKQNFSWPLFILPFFYSLSFGLFHFLVPTRLLSRLILTSIYAVGLYSLFLTQNIFTVASIRTIALLSGARIVSFVITLVSYFFLVNIIYTLHIPVLFTSLTIFAVSFFLILQSLWTINLEKSLLPQLPWIAGLSLCLFEMSLILWFWPSSPTVIALFLAGFFYTIVGPSQVWLDKRLFRGVMWEYIWVAVVVLCILLLFTAWR